MNATELNHQLIEAKAEADLAIRDLESRVRDSARADADWHYARASKYPQTEGTVDERRAQVELLTNDLRYKAKLTEDLRQSGLEAVKTKRQAMSSIQTVINLYREEAAFDRTGPA